MYLFYSFYIINIYKIHLGIWLSLKETKLNKDSILNCFLSEYFFKYRNKLMNLFDKIKIQSLIIIYISSEEQSIIF